MEASQFELWRIFAILGVSVRRKVSFHTLLFLLGTKKKGFQVKRELRNKKMVDFLFIYLFIYLF